MKKREKTPEEIRLEALKNSIADELGYGDKRREEGWGGLTAKESGKIGGIISKRNKGLK